MSGQFQGWDIFRAPIRGRLLNREPGSGTGFFRDPEELIDFEIEIRFGYERRRGEARWYEDLAGPSLSTAPRSDRGGTHRRT